MIKKAEKIITNIVEFYIPVLLLLVLFFSFIYGIAFRYLFKNPQSWTYEISTICYLSFVVLSACYVQRVDQHICFDMFFNKMNNKIRLIMQALSNIIVCITSTILTPASIKYIRSMKNLTSQILKIPRGLIFVCFFILFFSTAIRTGIKAFYNIKELLVKETKE